MVGFLVKLIWNILKLRIKMARINSKIVIAMAEEEPNVGTPEAKKFYASIFVIMPCKCLSQVKCEQLWALLHFMQYMVWC